MESPRRTPPWPSLLAFALSAGLLVPVQLLQPMARPMLLAERFLPGAGWAEILFLALWAALLTGRFLDSRAQTRWRLTAWSLFALVFFSQLALGLAGLDIFLMSGELHLPVPAVIAAGPVYRGSGWFMPVLFGAAALLVGPAWCSHLCYLGAADLQVARRKPARALPGWMTRAAWAMLPVMVGVALLLRLLGASPRTAAIAALAYLGMGLGVMVLASRRYGQMVHCNLWCPMGLLAKLLGKLSLFRLRIGADCTACGACTPACRYDALRPAHWENGRPGFGCALCGDCLGRCPQRAIRLGFVWGESPLARPLFMALAAALHAVFLGLARI